jgi:hypothetical protein
MEKNEHREKIIHFHRHAESHFRVLDAWNMRDDHMTQPS